MEADDANDYSLSPPDATRVAARALALAAVSCRRLIEKGAHDSGAEELRESVICWLDRIGIAEGLDPTEAALLFTPAGSLDRKTTVYATWRSEGMVVVSWALQSATLPPVQAEREPSEIANAWASLTITGRSNGLSHSRLEVYMGQFDNRRS